MTKNFHVVITRAGDASVLDGVNTYIWELASALSETGVKVTVCSGYLKSKDDARSKISKYFTNSFNGKHVSLKDNEFSGLKDVLFTWGIAGTEMMRDLDPDVIHINGAVPLFVGTPKVVTYHGIMNFDLNLNSLKCKLSALYNQGVYRSYKGVITVSSKAKEEYSDYIHTKNPAIIPPMMKIPTSNIKPFYDRELAIFHRGTHHRKNIKTTLLVFSHLKRKLPDLKLYVIGAKHDVENCSKELNLNLKDIEVLNKISKQQMLDIYSKVRVTLFPSYYEAFGYVALESLAAGTPVVASDEIAQELVIPGHTGYSARPTEAKVFADYAYMLLTQNELWTDMSKNAVVVAKQFGRENILPKIMSFYSRNVA